MVPLRLRLMGPLRRRSHDMARHRTSARTAKDQAADRNVLLDQLGASECASSGPARHADAGLGLLAAGPDEATLEAGAPVDQLREPAQGSCLAATGPAPTDRASHKHRRAQLMNQRAPGVLRAAIALLGSLSTCTRCSRLESMSRTSVDLAGRDDLWRTQSRCRLWQRLSAKGRSEAGSQSR